MADELLPDGTLEELDSLIEETEGIKPKKRSIKTASAKEQDLNNWMAQEVDTTISDGYIYSGAERQTQQAEAWRRYFREAYGNEDPDGGYSTYVSPLIQTQVNQIRAFITEQFHRNSAPVVKFRPKNPKDAPEAEIASDYVNYIFRNKNDGFRVVDETVMNAALLKVCPARVYMKTDKRSETVEFKHDGKSEEEAYEKLATFLVANPDLEDVEPYDVIEDIKEDSVYLCYRWKREGLVDRYPYIEVISPENFFVSRQAESLDEAKVVAKITNMRLSDIMDNYPEAPAMNGFKKKDWDFFWDSLDSDYQTWYSETTWFAKWSHDSLQYFEQYDNQNDDSAGLGTKQLFVVDAEIWLDPEDTGHAELYHIVKAGNYILHKEIITDRSFVCGSLIPTANRWLGIGLWDLLEQEAREETNLLRAFTDAAAQAAHPNLAFDPGVYEADDVIDRGPDTIIRVKVGATPQAGVNPLEVIKLPGPDGTVIQAADQFNQRASSATGVGLGFQGADSDGLSDMRLSEESVKTIQNNSTLMLNFMSRNYGAFFCELMKKVLMVAVKGGASKAILEIKDKWYEVEPMGLQPRTDMILNIDIGVNDAQEKVKKAQAIMTAVSLLSGGADPETGQTVGVQAQLLPTAGYEIGKLLLEANGAQDMTDRIFMNPEVQGDPQVQAAINSAVEQQMAQVQQEIAQMREQVTAQIKAELNYEKSMAEIELNRRKIELDERKQEVEEEKAAYDIAVKDEAEERREDADIHKATYEERKLDLEKRKLDIDEADKKAKIELDKQQFAKADTISGTVVS